MPATRREFLAAAMAAPAIVRSPQEKRGRGGREPERLPEPPPTREMVRVPVDDEGREILVG